MCFKKPLVLDQEHYQQLSNLWWMATSVSNGFNTGMRLTLSRWFQRLLLNCGNLPSICTFAVALCFSKSILTPSKRKRDLKQIWVVGVLFESSWQAQNFCWLTLAFIIDWRDMLSTFLLTPLKPEFHFWSFTSSSSKAIWKGEQWASFRLKVLCLFAIWQEQYSTCG